MGTFRGILGELLAQAMVERDQKDAKRASVEALHSDKHAAGRQSAQSPLSPQQTVAQSTRPRPVRQNAPRDSFSLTGKADTKERDAYFFQIGFDFGTSSSKAIVRDINTDRAWVYTMPPTASQSTFLIPSVVIYKNDRFERHSNVDMLYPKGGLYHLKMAIEKAALDKVNDPLLTEYKRILGSDFQYSSVQIAELACIYFLTAAFADIIGNIIQIFPDYSQNKDDQIAINMAIPVANFSDSRVRTLFEKILNISWLLAWEFDSSPNKLSIDKLVQNIKNCETALIEKGRNELCQVYPEVSANVQAFIRSPASSPNMTTIYFFSDIGAGTVDQSVFTYAGKVDNRLLNYFSANVFPRGSSQIEIAACGETRDEEHLEYWRKEKELGKPSSTLRHAKIKIEDALKADTEKTLHEALKCLPYGTGGIGITPDNTLKENIKFIFSGGGYTDFPYQTAVIGAFKKFLGARRDPIVTSIAKPTDLNLPQDCGHWINRLYVAYGLSFLYHELAENTFPSENAKKIKNKRKISNKRSCTCRGVNKHCSKCDGSGVQ